MHTDTENLEHLRRLIRKELSGCNPMLWPEVCRLQSTEVGYKRIEEQIIELALAEAMPVGAAMAQLEQDLSHYSPQDDE